MSRGLYNCHRFSPHCSASHVLVQINQLIPIITTNTIAVRKHPNPIATNSPIKQASHTNPCIRVFIRSFPGLIKIACGSFRPPEFPPSAGIVISFESYTHIRPRQVTASIRASPYTIHTSFHSPLSLSLRPIAKPI